jgi:hypothetical protein
MSLVVIGGCITRDVWQMVDKPLPREFRFYARTSLPSLFSEPVPCHTFGDMKLTSAWQRRMLLADLTKSAPRDIESNPPDAIIFDFLSERLDLIRLSNSRSIVTRSLELQESDILNSEVFRNARIIPRLSDSTTTLWMHALERLCAYLSSPVFADTKIYLHFAQWSTYYRSNGVVHKFPEQVDILKDNKAPIEEHNKLLRLYQTAFLEKVPGAIRIEVDERYRVACDQHPWKLSPFHYVKEYYIDLYERMIRSGIDLS